MYGVTHLIMGPPMLARVPYVAFVFLCQGFRGQNKMRLFTYNWGLLTYGSAFLLTVVEPQAKKTKPNFRTGGTISKKTNLISGRGGTASKKD